MRRYGLAGLALFACGGGPAAPSGAVGLELVTDQLSAPLFVTAPPGDTARVFVVEQGGRVRILRHDTLLARPFLDLSAAITSGGERGLLSIAFHPDYAANGYLFASYTDLHGDTRVVRYRASANPDSVDTSRGDTILAVAQPYPNHNGGLVLFGPDGKLWIGLGDGGSGGDPQGNGQNPLVLLGKLLRVDVDHGLPYTIPADNPFAGSGAVRQEIWALGLRNPWRFSFDRQTHDLYIADVGQNAWEEVDLEPAGTPGGRNYGWNVMEGTHCYASGCTGTGLTLPAIEYGHSDGCSITGGYVYRGTALPGLVGRYLYSDYCSGWIRIARRSGTGMVELGALAVSTGGQVSSFGEDARGELYVTTLGGRVYRIVSN